MILDSRRRVVYIRGGAGLGDSVPSANVTLYSTHDLRYRFSRTRIRPSLRTSIYTPTALRFVYDFKRDLHPSTCWRDIGTASQLLTAESATPTQGDASMSCFMPCHACHATAQPLPLLSRVALLSNPTPIALTGAASMIDSLSPHLIGSRLQLRIEAGE